jgi:hypothetical protein
MSICPPLHHVLLLVLLKTKTRHELIRQSVLHDVDADGVIGGEKNGHREEVSTSNTQRGTCFNFHYK